MKEILTHHAIDVSISGKPVELGIGYSKIELKTTKLMLAEKAGLIHGGFIFSAADYAAMLAVNDKDVVLGKANITFIKPVILGDLVNFSAKLITHINETKKEVSVIGKVGDINVFKGIFLCCITKIII